MRDVPMEELTPADRGDLVFLVAFMLRTNGTGRPGRRPKRFVPNDVARSAAEALSERIVDRLLGSNYYVFQRPPARSASV